MKKTILIIDDEIGICTSLEFALNSKYDVKSATNSNNALKMLNKEKIDLCLLDLKLGKDNGIDLLKKIKNRLPDMVVIMMTAYGTIETSVEAMQQGAYTYLIKPLSISELNIVLEKAFAYQDLNYRVGYLESELEDRYDRNGIIGKSPLMKDVLKLVDKVKDIDSSILITGESGTGKELIAREIHYSGKRAKYPFEVVNCAAIPEGLLEEEFFGHKKGAFTGAIENKKGKFALANNGTIFLDEIAELSYNLQAKLLRVLQHKEYSPVGSNEKISLNIRVLSATNKDLKKCIEEKTFREDLYFRLNVIEINLPPLRERKQDISLLINYFIKKYNIDFKKNITLISDAAEKKLLKYNYPGNIRQLANILEYAAVMANTNTIEEEDLPADIISYNSGNKIIDKDELSDLSLKEVEKKAIESALQANKGYRKATAEQLGISLKGLFNKIKEYNIDTSQYIE
ncbi:sigma-54-dependent transcriptional regulator [Lutispora saccharofermentans]|uniref:Stage 0 sporulation protein A homolog n=1 Tax=Lutispora saccharofermentans TaxID=3024236 RepID=A0ABT1NCB7_9FIRM|nr:sigma-54 dependent transcriptional regulator [Lutispora saccharofermentans]MCQ1528913.1 sigma-54 dependent transcriptional regulator [Lutispora saccharofermentans]